MQKILIVEDEQSMGEMLEMANSVVRADCISEEKLKTYLEPGEKVADFALN